MRDADQEARVDKRSRRLGEFIDSLGQGVGLGGLQGGRLVSFKVRLATEEDPSTLLVVRAEGVEGARIAFVGAFRVGDALLAWRERARVERMKWREDLPWGDRA